MASIATFLVDQSLHAINSINTGRNLDAYGVKSYSTWKTNDIMHSSSVVCALNEFEFIITIILSVRSSNNSANTSSGLF